MVDISVIIPSKNGSSGLCRSLSSALAQETAGQFSYEVIVALDKDHEESAGWFPEGAPFGNRLRICRARRPGANAARNQGLKQARGKIFFLLDDDCVMPEDSFLQKLYESLKQYPYASGVGGGYTINGESRITAACRNELDNLYLECNIQQDGSAGALLGGNVAYRREAIERYGLFDEFLTYGSSETELNDRILISGGELRFIKELSVTHLANNISLRSYFIKSFRQGAGKAYSSVKNKKGKNIPGSKKKWAWFIHIATGMKVPVRKKIMGAFFLFLNSLYYWSGMGYGFLRGALSKP